MGATGAGGINGYDPRYGGIPQLPTSAGLASNLSGILNQAIPGFNGYPITAISSAAPSGQFHRCDIADKAAAQACGGMPGSSTTTGTLSKFRSCSLADFTGSTATGITILGASGYSETVAPRWSAQSRKCHRPECFRSTVRAVAERNDCLKDQPALGNGGELQDCHVAGITHTFFTLLQTASRVLICQPLIFHMNTAIIPGAITAGANNALERARLLPVMPIRVSSMPPLFLRVSVV